LVSRYQIKLREPKVSIDLNEPAPSDEFPEFKVKVRTDKENIRELQKMVKQLKKEKAHVEQWSARIARKDSGFQEEEKRENSIAQRTQRNKFQTLLA
jgi:hypothetical protein